MDERIHAVEGAQGNRHWHCATCNRVIRARQSSFKVEGNRDDDYCSMSCARKALGVEEDGPAPCGGGLGFGGCRWDSRCCYYPPSTACANYEPEAKPFKHTICSGLAVEPEDEAEVWTWEDEDGPGVGGIRAFQYLRSSVGGRHVLLHQASWYMAEGDKALIAAAPQTAKALEAAKAENDELRNTLAYVRGRAIAALHCIDDGTAISKNHLKVILTDIDAALGKEDA